MKFYISIVVYFLALSFIPGLVFADDPDLDPFYTKGVGLDAAPPIHGVEEFVDPFSGHLKIVQTDLDLPQNGGLELKIQRTYDSAIWSRRDTSFPGIVAVNKKSPVGIGWTIHMGIVRNPSGNNPVLELPDGSRHAFYTDINDPNYARKVSKEFWTYKWITDYSDPYRWEVISPRGIVYTFEYGDDIGYNDGSVVAQCVKIENPSRTASISINYFNDFDSGLAPAYSYIESIVDSTGRTINFNYDLTLDPLNPKHQLISISYENQTFTYKYDKFYPDNGYIVNYLKEAIPPVGNSWKYAYEFSEGTKSWGQLAKFTYPTGGVVEYAYDDIRFATGIVSPAFRVVAQRKTSGRDIPAGTWTYQYSSGGSSGDVTTITSSPDGMKEVYNHYGWGNSQSGNVWRVGLLTEKKLYKGTTLLQTESYSWGAPDTSGGVKISNNSLENANWTGTGGWVSDSFIWVPFLTSKSTTRDGKTYTTSYSDYDSFGNSKTVSESGDKARTTTLTFWTNTSKNIVKGKPLTATVSGDFPGTFTTSNTYDTNGNLTQSNKYGVITKYEYFSNGNLSKIIDANNKTWTYTWSRGRISSIANPLYTVNRSINSDGTIASETNGRGYTTSYLYDDNLRLTRVTPPVGNSIYFSYPSDSSYRKQTRGSFTSYNYFDGFGRPTGSLNSKGVETDIDYMAYGTKKFSDSNVGDKVVYDTFERPTQITHKDNTTVAHSYSGSNVTVTDEADKSTLLTYNAFGDPDEKLLVSVRDANLNTAAYNYNILGSLTSISFGGVSRSFGYNSKNFLTSEANPETGSITYGRDNLGNMTSRADATGTITYVYDDINRLTRVYKGTEVVNFGYDKAGNRTLLSSPSASSTYTFDSANRLTGKSETISGTLYTTSFGYDANDNLTSITYPSGRNVSFTLNSYNEVTGVKNGLSSLVTSASYNLAGQPLSVVYANGLTNNFTYNSRYLPKTLTAGSVVDYSYGYDTRGNTISLTNGLDSNKNQTLGYDNLSRLTSFNGAWGTGSFAYDVTGNRITKVVAGASTAYSYSSNRLASASGNEASSYSYNGAGHVTGGTWNGTSYALEYDGFNNVKTFKSGAIVLAEAGYDGDGLRVTKAAEGRTTIYHYDLGGNVISENYSNGEQIADYVYLNGKLLARIDGLVDYDGDGVADQDDAFPNDPGEWLDTDGDGIGNNADSDDDNDQMPDAWETTYGLNPLSSTDAGQDGDGDGLTNIAEFQTGTDPTVADTDGDTYSDGSDVFPLDPGEWGDNDQDGVGDNADTDDDNDDMPDTWETTYSLDPFSNTDAGQDGDGDGLTNIVEFQTGTDPTVADTDGDTYSDGSDIFPLDPAEWADNDQDGVGDNADTDDDEDGYLDSVDAFPLDSAEWLDTDGDGIGNNADSDDDNDQMPDEWETTYGLDPLSNADAGQDGDGDGLTNIAEYQAGTDPTVADTDGDTYSDASDVFPLDGGEWADNDQDGVGDNADTDDDNDGMPDTWELEHGLNPLSSADESEDPDGDGWTNFQEYQQGSDPQFKDADLDGMQDDWEILYGLNPSDAADAALDNDDDGLTNLQEYSCGTNPNTIDSDGDGISDLYEDSDGDGLTNYQEYVFGTDPGLVDSDGDGFSDYIEWIAAVLIPIICM